MKSIGLDMGHATVKVVVLNENNKKINEFAIFHKGQGREVAVSLIEKLRLDPEQMVYFGKIGQQAQTLELGAVNGLSALVEGSLFLNPKVASIMEIGAQSTKYISGVTYESRQNMTFASNSSCSAGTGSFLEEQVSRLGIDLSDYGDIVKKGTQIPRIAGRCSVFSKTDMIHHQQSGLATADILLGLAYALVRNYKANVVQRLSINPTVAVIGGVAQNKAVLGAVRSIFSLKEKDLWVPENPLTVAALGAALCGKQQGCQVQVKTLIESIQNMAKLSSGLYRFPSLSSFGNRDGEHKHKNHREPYFSGRGHLGVDVGSTSTNLVFIDEKARVRKTIYLRTQGRPKEVVEEGLKILSETFENLEILSVGTTGSGRHLAGKHLHAKTIVNEITAQAKGGTALCPDADTIFEIGGQDSKYIRLEKGRVVDFEMNKICAAGTGSFIEEQGKKLGIDIEEYGDLALKGKGPLDLGDRCTVFIEGNISKAMAVGENKADIASGLSYSIVNNYLNRVVAHRPVGEKILLQGGVAYNQSVVNAFRSVLKKDIVVPPYFGVTGAYGAALLAREAAGEKEEAFESKSADLSMEREKLFLNGYTGVCTSDRPTVGIPRVLFLHKLFPLFHTFFKSLGMNVLISDKTNREIVAYSQEMALDETCYPVKLINGHVATLLEKGIDYLFLPRLYTMKHAVSQTREDYACVYMQTTAQVVDKVIDLEKRGVTLLSPVLSFKFGKKHMMQTLIQLGAKLGKNPVQTGAAIAKGMQALKNYEKGVQELGKKVIDNLKPDEKAFVIITRAYGTADPVLNMGILKKLKSMGHKVLTLSNLPAHGYNVFPSYPNMYWPFGQHILAGAKIIKSQKNLYAIYLTNHGCGPDTILAHHFKKEMGNKPYLHIEVDEHDSDVGVITRLEAFIESLKTPSEIKVENEWDGLPVRLLPEEKELILPYMYPYSQLMAAAFSSAGKVSHVLPKTSASSFGQGKAEMLSKESLVLAALIGDGQRAYESGLLENGCLFVPQTEGSETQGQYGRTVCQKLPLNKNKYGEKENSALVYSPFVEDILEDDFWREIFVKSSLLGDLILSAEKEKRQKLLEEAEKFWVNGCCPADKINEFAKKIGKIQKEQSVKKKKILVIGDPFVVFNPFLNQNEIEGLEKKVHLLYAPLSERLFMLWWDFCKKTDKNKGVLSSHLKNIKIQIESVHTFLDSENAFSDSLEGLIERANEVLPHYAGASGRYRMAKSLETKSGINGVISVSPLYENTATILKILRPTRSGESLPHIDIAYDGSAHGANRDKIENFIYYL